MQIIKRIKEIRMCFFILVYFSILHIILRLYNLNGLFNAKHYTRINSNEITPNVFLLQYKEGGGAK